MTILLDRGAAQRELTRRYPAPYLTLLYTLRRRRSIPPELFYGYWRDAHCQVSARLPGQHSLAAVDYDLLAIDARTIRLHGRVITEPYRF